ncbi:MAG: FMN-binding protein [Eubacteriaceae bacterium]
MKRRLKKSIALFLIIAFLISLAGCSSSITSGSYTGTATGFHGALEVTTRVDEDGKIIDVTVGENTETKGVGTVAIEQIPQSIIDAQSLDVDSVSGATVTSEGIINAVANSLEVAGATLSEYAYIAPEEEVYQTTAINKDSMPVKKEITDSVTVTDAKGREVSIDLPISSYAISTMDVIDYVIPLKGKEAFDMLVASGQDGGGGIQKYEKLYTSTVGNYMEHMGQISDHNAPFDLEMI